MVLHPNNKELQSQVIKRIGKMCFQEIKHLWSDNYDSILRTTSDVAMTHFSWESIWIEISTKAPTLVSILKSCLPVKTKLNRKPVLCLCVSMLLKLRNRKMCHVQMLGMQVQWSVSFIFTIREYGSTLYVGLARAVSPTNTNFRLTFLLTRLQEALYEDLAV